MTTFEKNMALVLLSVIAGFTIRTQWIVQDIEKRQIDQCAKVSP